MLGFVVGVTVLVVVEVVVVGNVEVFVAVVEVVVVGNLDVFIAVVEVVVVGNVEVFIAVVGTLLAVVGLGDVIGVSF